MENLKNLSSLAEHQAQSHKFQPGEKPLPLMREMPPAKKYPLDPLGPILGTAAKAIHEAIQAPDSICGNSVLAVGSLVAQDHRDVVVDGRQCPISLNLLTIGESGERKSMVDKIAVSPVRDYQKILATKYKAEKKIYDEKLENYLQAKKDRIRRQADPKSIPIEEGHLEIGDPPIQPLNPIKLVEEPTIEGLHKLMEHGQAGLGMFSDEGGRMLGGHGMNQENRLKTAATFSKLWDGSGIDRVRGGDGFSFLNGRRLSAHLMIQPVVANEAFSDEILSSQDFLARTLPVFPASTVGSRMYREIDLEKSIEIANYHSWISGLLVEKARLKDGTRNELEPVPYTLMETAKAEYIAFHNSVERELCPEGKYSHIRAFGSKAAEHALRIAGVLSFIRDPYSTEILREEMGAAITLVEFYLSEVGRINQASTIRPELLAAKQMLTWLISRRLSLFYLQQIYQ